MGCRGDAKMCATESSRTDHDAEGRSPLSADCALRALPRWSLKGKYASRRVLSFWLHKGE